MKKVLITSATVFAIVASAGMSMACPLNGHGQRGFAQNVHTSVSQANNHTGKKVNNHQTTQMIGGGSNLTSKQIFGQKNQSLTQKNNTYGFGGGTQFPDEVVIEFEDGDGYTVIFGKAQDNMTNDLSVYGAYVDYLKTKTHQ